MTNATKSEIFKAAWNEAHNAVVSFGGKASQYFAECLKAVYKRVRTAKVMQRLTATFDRIEAKIEALEVVEVETVVEVVEVVEAPQRSLIELIQAGVGVPKFNRNKPRKRSGGFYSRGVVAHGSSFHRMCSY